MPLKPRVGAGSLGGPLVHLDETGSTNDRARELAAAGAPQGTVLIAESQTAGRGRQGRTWDAPRERALTLSVVLRLEQQRIDQLPVVAALAVSEVCEAVAQVKTQIKWPNDVWIDRRKVAGILIEARPQEAWAVLGIGINVSTAEQEFPAELRPIATSLQISSGAGQEREGLLSALLDRLAECLHRGWDDLLEGYRARDALRESRISWAGGAGVAQGIDERANLIVLTDSGERVVLDAGEVHLDVG